MAYPPNRRASQLNPPAPERKAKMLVEFDIFQIYQQRYLQLAKARQPQVENSLLLRLMVQLMVSITILAIGVATGTRQSYLWIVLAAIGGASSWLLRHHRRHALVISGALGWIVMMFCVFRYLAEQSATPNDILPNLIMGILATLPVLWVARQNLSFAIFISWITTAIVSTINTNSLTVGLAIGISIVALPTLWLEYRSRIGLPPLPWSWEVRQLQAIPWQYLVQLGAIALLISLMIAACFSTLPQFNFPQLSHLTQNPTVTSLTDSATQTLRERAREFNNSYQSKNPEQSSPLTASANAAQSAQQQTVSDYTKSIENKYGQLPPQQQAQLQSQTQKIIQYQRQLESKTNLGSAAEQAEALATFLQNHTQTQTERSTPAPENPLNNLAANCPNPQTCRVQASTSQLQETFGLMARSIDIPPAVAKVQEAKQLEPQTMDEASSSINPTTFPPDPNVPAPPPSKPPQLNLLGLVVLIVVGIAGGCCWLWFRTEQQHQAQRRRFTSLPPLEQIYRQMLKHLQQHGLATKRAAQSPEEYAMIIHAKLPPTSARIVNRISQTYTAWRYGHQPTNVNLMQKLLQELMADLRPAKTNSPNS